VSSGLRLRTPILLQSVAGRRIGGAAQPGDSVSIPANAETCAIWRLPWLRPPAFAETAAFPDLRRSPAVQGRAICGRRAKQVPEDRNGHMCGDPAVHKLPGDVSFWPHQELQESCARGDAELRECRVCCRNTTYTLSEYSISLTGRSRRLWVNKTEGIKCLLDARPRAGPRKGSGGPPRSTARAHVRSRD
jgi:hypothetical protein